MTDLVLKQCDIILVEGHGWVSDAIRWATTAPGETPSVISHVGFVVHSGLLTTSAEEAAGFGPSAKIQEAVFRVRRNTLAQAYGGKPDRVMIARPLNIDEEGKALILNRAGHSFGRGYGYGKIGLQLGDALLSKAFGEDIDLFRRLALSPFPICSYDLTDCWSADGLDFGCSARNASPDDIHDYVVEHPRHYEIIRELEVIP
jgi:hypothetical protein